MWNQDFFLSVIGGWCKLAEKADWVNHIILKVYSFYSLPAPCRTSLWSKTALSLYLTDRVSFTKMKINSTNSWTVRGSAIALLSNTHSRHVKRHIHTRTDTLSTESIVQVDGLYPDSQLHTDEKKTVLLLFFVFSHWRNSNNNHN